MTAYQIKVTKLTGAHKGESFIMAKGGFVVDEGTPQPGWMCYGSLKLAKAACTRLSKRNRLDYEAEQRNIKWRK